jgi:geranylgeranyl diphosphate synthase type I
MPTTFQTTLRQLTDQVDTALSAVLAEKLSEARGLASEVAPFASAVNEFAQRGGKRLRGALVLIGHRAARSEDEAARRAAAALELFHAYLLVHDDIMDRDEQRRGGPTLHAHFRAQRGDANAGTALGLLGGDLLAAWSQELLAAIEGPGTLRALRALSEAHTQAVVGQYLDMEPAETVTESALRAGHDMKTGGYSFLLPLRVGAALGGATPAQEAPFVPYSLHLGRAFQAKDDLLGLYGDSQQTGKAVGFDVVLGRRTWLIADLLLHHPSEGRALLAARPKAGQAIEAFVQEAQSLLERTGTRARCESYVAREIALATEALAGAPLPEDVRAFLTELAAFIGAREI